MMSSTAVASQVETFQAKIITRTARVGIVGLGYVGLPLAVEFAKAGFTVTGIDLMGSKVESINLGHSYVQDVPDEVVGELVALRRLCATTDFSVIRDLDTINIRVPTPRLIVDPVACDR
jgi:UDP-N-acetyl-D-glucosamine dehydrogenase